MFPKTLRELYTFFSLKLTLKFFKKILKEKQDQTKQNVKTIKNIGKTWKKPIDTLSKCREIYAFFSLKLTLKFFKKILKENKIKTKQTPFKF